VPVEFNRNEYHVRSSAIFSVLTAVISSADQIILLVYDVTNSSSFEILDEWLSQVKNFIDAYDDPPLIALVGNKCDMEHQRTVKRDRSHRFAAEHGFPYHDMSARTGESVMLSL